ncbi:MAG: hypothetical protein IT277_07130 [Ignavibacteriaceae bacterium]|nr:hypothetical protein [Ignavibacteriaceae bacterium]
MKRSLEKKALDKQNKLSKLSLLTTHYSLLTTHYSLLTTHFYFLPIASIF